MNIQSGTVNKNIITIPAIKKKFPFSYLKVIKAN